MSRIAILGYHKIGPPAPDGWDTWFRISESLFTDHLATLRDGGWQVLDGAAFAGGLADPSRLPDRAALITFDDGYRSLREVALPCLSAFDFSGVLFMPTDYIGHDNEFDRDNEPTEPLCDWDDLEELQRCGISIQSHGASHRTFSELSAAERRDELERSKAGLEDRLGRPVELFAYPYGDDVEGTAGLLETLQDTGYRAAFGYGGDPFSTPATDPYRLPRVAIGPETDLGAVLEDAGDTDDD